MYHAKIWDEDKLNIHAASYGSSKYGNIFKDDQKKDDVKYHEQKYGSKEGDVSSDYMKKEDAKEKEEKKQEGIFENFEEEKKEKELKEEDIPFKAARQVFSEAQREIKQEKRKDLNTIEDAIKKAIEGEKSVIIMDS